MIQVRLTLAWVGVFYSPRARTLVARRACSLTSLPRGSITYVPMVVVVRAPASASKDRNKARTGAHVDGRIPP